MKMHESEILKRTADGDIVLARTAVPGGWLYESCTITRKGGMLESVTTNCTFVPDPVKSAGRVVDAVLADLLDRRGFRQTWDGIDVDIRQEIRAELTQKIAKAL